MADNNRLVEDPFRSRPMNRDGPFFYILKNDSSPLMSSQASSVRSSSVVRHCPARDWDDFSDSDASSNEPPSLTRGNSIASATSAARTDEASALHGGYILESHDGLLTLPNRYQPDADLLCPFQILDCNATFSHIIEFKMHVFAHFRGHPLPSFASCFLCDDKFSQTLEDDSAWAWNNMLGHMAHDHFRQGQRLATIRTDFVLMKWMYTRRIISDVQFKRTQLSPVPTILPSVNGGAPEILNMPPAPMPPSDDSSDHDDEPSLESSPPRNQSEAFVVIAGRRAERIRRDATRPFMRLRTRTEL